MQHYTGNFIIIDPYVQIVPMRNSLYSFFLTAPSDPVSFNGTVQPPSKLHAPKVMLTWSSPTVANGVMRSYTLLYSHDGLTRKKSLGNDTLSFSLDVLGGVTYQFHVRAVTIKPGPNATLTVVVPEYGKVKGNLVLAMQNVGS